MLEQRFAPRNTPESIIFSRASFYDTIFNRFLIDSRRLKEVYGGKIPGTVKKRLIRNLKRSGFILEPGKGWSPPNSVDLSSMHSK